MKFTSVVLLASCTSSTLAFAPSSCKVQSVVNQHGTQLNASNEENSPFPFSFCSFKTMQENMQGAISATLLAGAIWASPAATAFIMLPQESQNPFLNEILIRTSTSVVADAKEMASGSGSRVNKDPESLLRLGLPIPKDKEVRVVN